MDAGDLGNEGVAGVVGDEMGAAWEALGVPHLVRSSGLNGFDGKAIPRSGPGEANFLIRHDANHGRTSAIGSTFEQDCGFAYDVWNAPHEAVRKLLELLGYSRMDDGIELLQCCRI